MSQTPNAPFPRTEESPKHPVDERPNNVGPKMQMDLQGQFGLTTQEAEADQHAWYESISEWAQGEARGHVADNG